MNDFKSGQEDGADDISMRSTSETGGLSKELPKLPKSTRKTTSEKGSPTEERSKRRSTNKSTSRRSKELSENGDEFSSSWTSHSTTGLPKMPKKTKRKKKTTKESDMGGSTRSRLSDADNMSDTGSVRSMPQFDIRSDDDF